MTNLNGTPNLLLRSMTADEWKRLGRHLTDEPLAFKQMLFELGGPDPGALRGIDGRHRFLAQRHARRARRRPAAGQTAPAPQRTRAPGRGGRLGH